MKDQLKLSDFIKERGLKREISSGTSLLACEKGDYILTDAKELGTRIDYEYNGVISMARYFK